PPVTAGERHVQLDAELEEEVAVDEDLKGYERPPFLAISFIHWAGSFLNRSGGRCLGCERAYRRRGPFGSERSDAPHHPVPEGDEQCDAAPAHRDAQNVLPHGRTSNWLG